MSVGYSLLLIGGNDSGNDTITAPAPATDTMTLVHVHLLAWLGPKAGGHSSTLEISKLKNAFARGCFFSRSKNHLRETLRAAAVKPVASQSFVAEAITSPAEIETDAGRPCRRRYHNLHKRT